VPRSTIPVAVHVPVHRNRRGELLPRLPALTGAPEELSEAEMAVGRARAHLELVRTDEGPAVVLLG
jgi:hypothetical protein